jgi:transposase InsO family protein
MLRLLFLFLFLFSGIAVFPQVEVTTPDGRKVLLYENGTWKYAEGKVSPVVLSKPELPAFKSGDQVIHHSDQGSQYTSVAFGKRCENMGVRPSMGSVGDAYDNAMAEALNGTYKAELIHARRPWRTRAQAEFATIEWIRWYNTARLHSEIGDIPPAEHEAAHYRQITTREPANTR